MTNQACWIALNHMDAFFKLSFETALAQNMQNITKYIKNLIHFPLYISTFFFASFLRGHCCGSPGETRNGAVEYHSGCL